MKIDKKIISLLIVCLLASTVMPGCIEQKSGLGLIVIPAASASASGNPKYAMASYYSSEGLVINASVSQYDLPLDLTSITNINSVYSKFYLKEGQKNLLSENGFIAIDYDLENDIIQPYKDMKIADIPIFVTSDTLLHLYHIQFDETLKGIEEREFFGKILNLSKALFDKSINDYQGCIDINLK